MTEVGRKDEGRPRAETDGHNGHNGHEAHAGHAGHKGHASHAEVFRRRFWACLVLSVPVVLLSDGFADLFGYSPPDFPLSTWVPPVFGSAVFAYGGSPFLTGARTELAARRPGMMTLISMAITVAFVASWAATFDLVSDALDFWWELALLVDIMLLGHWLEIRALGAASGALDALAELLPDTAERSAPDGSVEVVPVADLVPGDTVLVRAGGRVPADGKVAEGAADFDESLITGESKAAHRGVGDTVVAGTVAVDNIVRVTVTATGADTQLAGIGRMVEEAQRSHSRAQALADRAAALLFYYAVAAALATVVVWSVLGNAGAAVERMVTVLVIACPHALGLAIPLVIAISTELAARQGILVKDRIALERMRDVDTVLFDKTGTLTRGRPAVTAFRTTHDHVPDEVLALAGAAERDSGHPLARAVVRAARERGALPGPVSDFRTEEGVGIRAAVAGREVRVGGPGLLRAAGLTADGVLAAEAKEWSRHGATVLYVVVDGVLAGGLALEDEVRVESYEAVAELHAEHVKVAVITGDARPVAVWVAGQLGVDEVYAEVLPRDKDGKVAAVQAKGRRAAMVGDGVNDAPALARADVGIAIGAGTDVAVQSAGIVLASDDPRAVVGVRRLSRAVNTKMRQNLAWAAGYNLVTVPLAAGVLAWAGVTMPMELAAVLMSLSTVVVALNAQLLRRLDLRPAATADAMPPAPFS
ncbi:heavy metal translocating P-type ATPase [Yinghuangia seranimata]|uniref:heavy metal translocating P-type ATPase n=1 Tax=Yinghuangia seranimata TaxID=408067 RepID=UPI00248C3408|nr:heavy metal translocating P-type ATPase [Yinghuangia seranimata]MDI2129906.1 heavy metal translocating P-type ATPase [Yinghuangia seranimata]